jgi:hypothetical protein
MYDIEVKRPLPNESNLAQIEFVPTLSLQFGDFGVVNI